MKNFSAYVSVLLLGMFAGSALADVTLLNASYDVARDVYKDFNPLFQKHWKAKTGENIEIKQSHGGSTKQVRAVADGLEADVVTMNQANDIEFLADKGLVTKDWTKKFPNNASPYTSAMVFIVRKGNPKGIKDWNDLAAPGTQIIIPHPKNTGNGRNTYLSAVKPLISYYLPHKREQCTDRRTHERCPFVLELQRCSL